MIDDNNPKYSLYSGKPTNEKEKMISKLIK